MKTRTFHIGDVLSLLFYYEADNRELFGECDAVEGIDTLVMFMLGIDESEAEEYFEDDYRFSLSMDACIRSLHCQFEDLSEDKELRESLKRLGKSLKNAYQDAELETNWLARQADTYGTTLPVASIGFLFIPPGQERFETVESLELFSDRPMNVN